MTMTMMATTPMMANTTVTATTTIENFHKNNFCLDFCEIHKIDRYLT